MHLSDLACTLEAVPSSDVPSLDGYGDRNVWGELINSALDPNELPEDSELLLFLKD